MSLRRIRKKKIKRLDERFIDFLFGPCRGYLWGDRCIQDKTFKRFIMQQGGFVDVHLENRLLYQEVVPFTIFHTPECEFAFNRLSWQGGNLLYCYRRSADLFLFRNHQRLITVSLRQSPSLIRLLDGIPNHRVEQSQIHWTQTNAWLNDYLDFIQRIEHLMHLDQTHMLWQKEFQQQSLSYKLGYTLGKLFHRY